VDERERARVQTGRNVAGVEHEQRGEWDAAIALYEANLAEGFPGPWPYDRLAALYAKREEPGEVVRVLERAVTVFAALPPRPPERRLQLRAFRQRLAEAKRGARRPAPRRATRSN
jgi:hypothetical protein